MTLTLRKAASLLAASALGVSMMTGAAWAATSTAQAGGAAPSSPTATLSPAAAAGSAVTGILSVIDSTDWGAFDPAVGASASFSDFHDFGYAYRRELTQSTNGTARVWFQARAVAASGPAGRDE
jgi:hypothetical protein